MTQTNKIIFNPDKTYTLSTPGPEEYNTQLSPQINNTTLPMNSTSKSYTTYNIQHTTYNKHINNTTTNAHKTYR